MTVIWSREALEKLRLIEKYIAQNNPDRAKQFINTLIEKGESLTAHPHKGRIVPELSNPDIRELLFKNYRIVYRSAKSGIEILTVFESHRLLHVEDIQKE